jgi:hypothetical protein
MIELVTSVVELVTSVVELVTSVVELVEAPKSLDVKILLMMREQTSRCQDS